MEKIKLMLLTMLVGLMGTMITSCGDDKENGGGNEGTYGNYTLCVDIVDKGTLPDAVYTMLKSTLARYGNTLSNVTLGTAKAALDEALNSFENPMSQYSYTLEFYITDSNNNKVYSRTIEIKATEKEENGGNESGEATGTQYTYMLCCTISDIGTLPEQMALVLKQGLEQNVRQPLYNMSLDAAKEMVDKAVNDAITNGDYNNEEFNYTVEFFIIDKSGNKVYSRYIEVKDGNASAK